jgi:WD40 repeat protein
MLLSVAALLAVAADPTPPPTAILKTHCHRCHGEGGSVEGGFNFALDLPRLTGRGLVVPGDPDRSPLFRRVAKGQMPPPGETPRPADADVAALRAWIAAGAPAPTAPTFTPVTPAAVTAAVLADLESADRRARRFRRYLSIAHLHNAGLGPDELATYRQAVGKLLNSLSWHPRIVTPTPVDAAGVVLRIDLRDLMWDAALWNRLLAEYPYGVTDGRAASRAVTAATGTRVPVVRADWFIAAASRPPLYSDLLQLPTSLAELERLLRVDAVANIRQERVARVGFNGSGVARNNRLLERHDSIHGAYWRTYDFAAVPQNLADRGQLLPDPRNLFAFPLGPAGALAIGEPFRHAGGEAIFDLPNGLHGYMLVNANGERVDKAPVEIVSDPRRPDRAVEAGVSCMGCHVRGIQPKTDQVREFVAHNPAAFSRAQAELVRALHPPAAVTTKKMEEDAGRYLAALAKAGARPGRTEPVNALTRRYEADLDLPTAAAEAGAPADELRRRLDASDASLRNLGTLRASGGTVSRAVFVQAFGDLVRDLDLGTLFRPAGTDAADDGSGTVDPLEGPNTQVNAAAITPDGRSAVFAGADRGLRVIATEDGHERRSLVGHTGSVWCVAVSPDGSRAASGAADGSVRLWDLAGGSESHRLDGHLGLVTAVAWSPDGRRVVSAGQDHAVVIWDADSGRELARREGRANYPTALAFAADGQQLLVASGASLRVWSADGDKELAKLGGHTDWLTTVTFAGPGAVSAGDDGTARVWDVATGKCLAVLTGHAGPVYAAAVSPDGSRLATAGADRTVRLWDLDAGKELAAFRRHADAVVAVAFADGGRQTLSADRGGTVKAWDVSKFVRAIAPPPRPAADNRPAARLEPVASWPLDGTAGALALSADRRHLVVSDRAGGRLVRLNASTLKPDGVLPVAAEALAASRAGRTLAAVSRDGPRGKLHVIDAAKWSVRRSLDLAFAPFDVAVRDDGTAFVSGGGATWADVTVFDSVKGAALARWGGAWGRSCLRLSADGRRLYVVPQGVTPGTVEAWPLGDTAERPTPGPAVTPEGVALAGEPVATPDGAYLLWPSGAVLRTAPDRADDLKPAAKLAPFAAFAADPAAGRAVAVGTDGELRVYEYPSFRPAASLRVAGTAYRVALDGAAGRLYVAVFDTAELRDRPRAAGLGDVRAYRLPAR